MERKWPGILGALIAGVAIGAGGMGLIGGCRTTVSQPIGAATSIPEGLEWINLLSAESVSGWRNVSDDNEIFEIEDGVLHIFGRSKLGLRYVGYSANEFSDFELHVEVKVTTGANSGIFLRANADDPVQRGFEVQVLDDHGKAPSVHGSGAIYDVVSPMHTMSLPAGEWNSYDIRVVGNEVSVHMNGWLVVQSDFSKMTEPIGKFETAYKDLSKSGHLMLQDHGGEVWYRNIYIQALSP